MHRCLLSQGCQILVLDGQHLAELNSNLYQHTCLELSNNPKDFHYIIVSCIYLGLELNSAEQWTSRSRFGHP